jgi:hypothetical protein
VGVSVPARFGTGSKAVFGDPNVRTVDLHDRSSLFASGQVGLLSGAVSVIERIAKFKSLNVMPDPAVALKYNPGLKAQLSPGYCDLANRFSERVYEMQHLPIPAKLQNNRAAEQY